MIKNGLLFKKTTYLKFKLQFSVYCIEMNADTSGDFQICFRINTVKVLKYFKI